MLGAPANPHATRGPGGGLPSGAEPCGGTGAALEMEPGAAWAFLGAGLMAHSYSGPGPCLVFQCRMPLRCARSRQRPDVHNCLRTGCQLRTSAIARTNGMVSPAVLWLPSLTLTSMSRRSVPAKRRPARALPGLGGSAMSAPARQSRPGPSHQRRAACDGKNEQVSSKLLIRVIIGAYGMS